MEIFEVLIHLDEHLANLVNFFGPWTYLILFGIIFAETGLVVTPFCREIRYFLWWGHSPEPDT